VEIEKECVGWRRRGRGGTVTRGGDNTVSKGGGGGDRGSKDSHAARKWEMVWKSWAVNPIVALAKKEKKREGSRAAPPRIPPGKTEKWGSSRGGLK